jgi:signal peptidase II
VLLNIIDSVLRSYLDDSQQQLATLFSDQPYGTWFHGKVVDMLYFPLARNPTQLLPIWGGKEFTFNAIFNVADMAISTGVGILIFSTKSISSIIF